MHEAVPETAAFQFSKAIQRKSEKFEHDCLDSELLSLARGLKGLASTSLRLYFAAEVLRSPNFVGISLWCMAQFAQSLS